MKKANLKIKGMHCPSCKTLIEEALLDLGVKSKVDLNKGIAEILFDEKKVSLAEIKQAIQKEGNYQVQDVKV